MAAAVLAVPVPAAHAAPVPRAAQAAPSGEGGQPVYGANGARCTLGFNVRANGAYSFLTAGGCAQAGLTLYADPALTVELGTVAAVTNVAVGLVRYVDPQVERPGSVRLYPGSQDITSARSPVVGQSVCRSGPTTGVRCGTVTAVNQTVRFPEGTITGLARTNICVEPGDTPGAPYFSGTTAIGLGIGGSGTCTSGGTSFFQPVTGVLAAFGVAVY
ncbi:S1 family peptidase [Actinomadura chokoriensis]|uniref:S1 family peptidase n=1 Tax=Actinomadura chokoriensis TaxID=454156 RepID=UPI0031F74A32